MCLIHCLFLGRKLPGFHWVWKVTENFTLRDSKGNFVPSRIIQEQNISYLEFLADNIPALGFGCFEYFQDEANQGLQYFTKQGINFIENKFYKIEWSPSSGDLIKIWDKDNNREVLSNPGNVIVSLGENNPDMEGSLRLNGTISKIK